MSVELTINADCELGKLKRLSRVVIIMLTTPLTAAPSIKPIIHKHDTTHFMFKQHLKKNTIIQYYNRFSTIVCYNESGRFGALKSDSTHHFFRNACTKSGSLRFSQFSGCWLIFSVYILMIFDFPFVRLFGVR